MKRKGGQHHHHNHNMCFVFVLFLMVSSLESSYCRCAVEATAFVPPFSQKVTTTTNIISSALTTPALTTTTTTTTTVSSQFRPLKTFLRNTQQSEDDIVVESYHHHHHHHHHVAIKTRNITIAIQFYELLGYQVDVKFRAGPARAAWLCLQPTTNDATTTSSSRLELIEVPSYMLNEPPGMKRRALDLMSKPELLGLNHVCLDVTLAVQQQQHRCQENTTSSPPKLKDWLEKLNQQSITTFGKSLRIALEPQQQIIGQNVYELGFLYDADGTLLELLNYQSTLSQPLLSDGWEPLQQKLVETTTISTVNIQNNETTAFQTNQEKKEGE
mmetsp:Transcript_621/g.922  ORF Transcript_621/g.922 Transcript_621/m.922 type:complete len:328 (-) Transcript_621:208-1191(-)